MRHIHQRFGLSLALVSAVLLTSACTSPQPKVTTQPRPTPAVTTAPAPTAHRFLSTLFGFRLTLPKDWTGRDAQAYPPWDGQSLLGMDSTEFADFTDSTGGRLFTFGSTPLTMGTTLAAWQRTMVRGSAEDCIDVHTTKSTTLGGEPALTWTSQCPDVQTTKFAVLHGGHGYVAIFLPKGSRMNAADMAVFGPILRSFRFTD